MAILFSLFDGLFDGISLTLSHTFNDQFFAHLSFAGDAHHLFERVRAGRQDVNNGFGVRTLFDKFIHIDYRDLSEGFVHIECNHMLNTQYKFVWTQNSQYK